MSRAWFKTGLRNSNSGTNSTVIEFTAVEPRNLGSRYYSYAGAWLRALSLTPEAGKRKGNGRQLRITLTRETVRSICYIVIASTVHLCRSAFLRIEISKRELRFTTVSMILQSSYTVKDTTELDTFCNVLENFEYQSWMLGFLEFSSAPRYFWATKFPSSSQMSILIKEFCNVIRWSCNLIALSRKRSSS